MSEKMNVSPLKIAATYIGGIIGAGFGTGQEVMRFFVIYGGFWGLAGVILGTLLFILMGDIIMELGYRYGFSSCNNLISRINNPIIARFLDLLITLFFFAGFSIMLAATGAVFEEQLGLPYFSGNLLMMLLTVFSVAAGLNRLLSLLIYLVPGLLLGIMVIAINTLINNTLDGLWRVPLSPVPVGGWLISSVSYVSYNLIIGLGVLTPLGRLVADRRLREKGVLLGGAGLGTGLLGVFLILLLNRPGVLSREIPLLYAVSRMPAVMNYIYLIILLTAIYTTAISNFFAFSSRVFDIGGKNIFCSGLIFSGLIGFCLSLSGFSKLVYIIYPLSGYMGILIVIYLIHLYIKGL